MEVGPGPPSQRGGEMSLAINPDEVGEVLLADGWHEVDDLADGSGRSSFDLDSYEYVLPHPDSDRDGLVLLGGGQSDLVCSTGFIFQESVDEDGERHHTTIMGPITAIPAVRMR